jgi:sulfur-oxidizing protein SoxZ
MKIRATLKGDVADIRVLIAHPMETGQRKDAKGEIVPQHFIQSIVVTHNGNTVYSGQWSQAVSRNPVFAVRVRGAKAGDKVSVTWVTTGRATAHRRSHRYASCWWDAPISRCDALPTELAGVGNTRVPGGLPAAFSRATALAQGRRPRSHGDWPPAAVGRQPWELWDSAAKLPREKRGPKRRRSRLRPGLGP